jgi:hypothetical protein
MKKLLIEMRVDEATGRIATAWETEGLSRKSICDLFEIKGMVDNFQSILDEKVKTFAKKEI